MRVTTNIYNYISVFSIRFQTLNMFVCRTVYEHDSLFKFIFHMQQEITRFNQKITFNRWQRHTLNHTNIKKFVPIEKNDKKCKKLINSYIIFSTHINNKNYIFER